MSSVQDMIPEGNIWNHLVVMICVFDLVQTNKKSINK